MKNYEFDYDPEPMPYYSSLWSQIDTILDYAFEDGRSQCYCLDNEEDVENFRQLVRSYTRKYEEDEL